MNDKSESMFKLVMDALAEQAFENKNLTYEELEIIKQVAFDMREYENSLKKALEDNIISEDENKILTNLKNQISNNALKIANIDQMLDSEEEGMLNRLCEVIDKYL